MPSPVTPFAIDPPVRESAVDAGMADPAVAQEQSAVNGVPAWVVVVLLSAALGIGLWIRVAPLTGKGLWEDELRTLRRTDYASLGEVVSELRRSPFPPLHYMIVYAWRQVCPDPVLGIRGPSFLCGLLTIPLMYVVWRPVIGRSAALWAAALTSLSAYHAWVTVDAKMYAAVWLLACISHGTFLRLLLGVGERSAAAAAAYVVCTGMAPLFSYTAVSIPAVQGAFLVGLLLCRRGNRKREQLAWALLFGSLIPLALWSPYLLESGREAGGLGWIGPARAERFWFDVREMLGLFLCGFRAADHGELATFGRVMIWLQGLSVVTAAIALSVVLARLIEAGPQESSGGEIPIRSLRDALLYAAFGVVATFAASFGFSLVFRPVWGVARYLTPIMPLLTVAVAVTVVQLQTWTARAALILPLIVVNLGMGWLDRTATTRTPWPAIVEQIATTTPGRETLVVWEDADGAQEAVMALRFGLAQQRDEDGVLTERRMDRVLRADEFSGGENGFLVEAARSGQSPPKLRQLTRGRYKFERLAAWDIYGRSDIPNPSVTRKVTLWSMQRSK